MGDYHYVVFDLVMPGLRLLDTGRAEEFHVHAKALEVFS